MYIVHTNFGSIFLQCTDWEDVQVLKVFFYSALNGRMYKVWKYYLQCTDWEDVHVLEVFFTVH